MTPNKLTSEEAKELSELGASKGGYARANVLTREERTEIAKKASEERWRKAREKKPQEELEVRPQLPYSMFRGTLKLGDMDVECHVLNDFRRVLTQREVVRVLSGGRESGNLARYIDRNPLLANSFNPGPIEFTVDKIATAHGSEGTALIEICSKYLEARERGLLKKSQLNLARQAEIIIRSVAKVGIIALIDEATGFQEYRKKRDLQLKLQAFIADELQEWAKMFPDEFWFELARLEGIRYSPRSRPLRWGKYIMMFVYDAVDGDIGKELRKKNPNPHFLKNHHQWLKKFGRDRVHDQIERVVTIMKLCDNMEDFRAKFERVFKKATMPDQLAFIWSE